MTREQLPSLSEGVPNLEALALWQDLLDKSRAPRRWTQPSHGDLTDRGYWRNKWPQPPSPPAFHWPNATGSQRAGEPMDTVYTGQLWRTEQGDKKGGGDLKGPVGDDWHNHTSYF